MEADKLLEVVAAGTKLWWIIPLVLAYRLFLVLIAWHAGAYIEIGHSRTTIKFPRTNRTRSRKRKAISKRKTKP